MSSANPIWSPRLPHCQVEAAGSTWPSSGRGRPYAPARRGGTAPVAGALPVTSDIVGFNLLVLFPIISWLPETTFVTIGIPEKDIHHLVHGFAIGLWYRALTSSSSSGEDAVDRPTTPSLPTRAMVSSRRPGVDRQWIRTPGGVSMSTGGGWACDEKGMPTRR